MSERLSGYCPMGCGETLFIGNGGHATCSYIGCPEPSAVSKILGNRETEHVVAFAAKHFTVTHPLRERLGDMAACRLHQWIAERDGPPVKPGVYRALPSGRSWSFVEKRAVTA